MPESERAYVAAFRPHLQVQTERAVPSPIFVAALLTVTRLRVVPLPDEALTANDEARDRIIKSIIIDQRCENGGRVPAFGEITGYFLDLGCGIRRFRFRVAVQRHGRSSRGDAKGRAAGGGDFGDEARRYAANRTAEGHSNPGDPGGRGKMNLRSSPALSPSHCYLHYTGTGPTWASPEPRKSQGRDFRANIPAWSPTEGKTAGIFWARARGPERAS